MTYCIGWKTTNYACLIADSAITSSVKPTNDYGTFGELQKAFESGPCKGMYIEERAVKIIHLNDRCAVCYSGNVQLALKIIRFLIDYDHLLEDIPNALKIANNSLGPFKKSVCLIFATHDDSGPVLLTWNTLTNRIDRGSSFYEIGSLVSKEKTIVPKFLAYLASNHIPENECLEIVMSMVQSLGVREPLYQQNIGGAICGTMVSSKGVKWNDPIDYVLYEPTFKNDAKLITLFSLTEGILIFTALRDNDVHKFIQGPFQSITTEKVFQLPADYNEQATSGKQKYTTFINLNKHHISVVPFYEGIKLPFLLEFIDQTTFHLSLTPDFKKALEGGLYKTEANTIGFVYAGNPEKAK